MPSRTSVLTVLVAIAVSAGCGVNELSKLSVPNLEPTGDDDEGVDGASSDASSKHDGKSLADAGADAKATRDASLETSAPDDGAVIVTSDGGPNTVLQVAVGPSHTCAILENHRVKCWGMANAGSLGLGDANNRGDMPGTMGDALAYVELGSGRTVKAIAVGTAHSCAILDNDEVKCWGSNLNGQCGLGTTQIVGEDPTDMGDQLPYVDLGTGRSAKAIQAGNEFTCARLDNDTVKCWGTNDFGELGLGNTVTRGDDANEMGDHLAVVSFGTGRTAKFLSSLVHESCVILDDGTTKCWGAGSEGVLGSGNVQDRGTSASQLGNNWAPVNLGTGRTATSVAAGGGTMCAVLDTQHVKCWGRNYFGSLGLEIQATALGDQANEMGDNLPTVALGTGRTAKAVGVGTAHTCVILDNGKVKCWGANFLGSLGLGDGDPRGDQPSGGEMGDNLPYTELGTGRTAKAISVNDYRACAILDNDQLKCWGSNSEGELGLGDTDNRGDGPGEMGDNLPFVKLVGP